MTKLNSGHRDSDHRDECILILAPIGRDAEMTTRFLREAGLSSLVCHDGETLHHEMQNGCGLLFLTGEALTPEITLRITDLVQRQPSWSDTPIVVLTGGGSETPSNTDALAALTQAGNVTLIERPVRGTTLLSTIQAALRARRRQYEVRDHLDEEVRIKDALRQSEERLRIALDAAHLGAWQLDLATGLLNCTESCKASFGLPPEAAFSYETLTSTIHPDDRDIMRSSIESAIAKRSDYRSEYRVVWPDGTLRWILASGRANYDADGQPDCMVGVTLDITERKTVEHERERLLMREQLARAEAETASRLKDEFLATVSHELRTPLTAILGWAHMLRSGRLEADMMANGIEVIERNARSQAQLINDLLDVSRIITGKLRLDLQIIDPTKVIEGAIDVVRPSAEAKNIEIQAWLDPQAGSISADSERLQQVVWNLLANAVKFTPAEGKVQIRLERTQSHLEITVSDSGKGIDAAFLSAVFDRFRQADQTSTRAHGGLGLGLSIVHQIVELHDGTVRAESGGDGQGATFVVQLPLTITALNKAPQNNNASDEESAPLECLPQLERLQVLVVDDEKDTRDLLRTILEGCGSHVRTAGSAAEALDVLQHWKPHVLVSDIGMPGEDGCALIAKVRTLQPKDGGAVPAIALTAYVRKEDEARALDAGFQVHLPKPIEPAALIGIVADLAAQTEA